MPGDITRDVGVYETIRSIDAVTHPYEEDRQYPLRGRPGAHAARDLHCPAGEQFRPTVAAGRNAGSLVEERQAMAMARPDIPADRRDPFLKALAMASYSMPTCDATGSYVHGPQIGDHSIQGNVFPMI